MRVQQSKQVAMYGGGRSLSLVFLCVLSSVIALLPEVRAETEACQYKYLRQPPIPNEQDQCNPYHPPGTDLGLLLECDVSGPSGSIFEIRWFHNNSRSQEPLLEGQGVTIINTSNSTRNGSIMMSDIKLTGAKVTAMGPGEYYCQVYDIENDALLQASNSFVVDDMSVYGLFVVPCVNLPHNDSVVCINTPTSASPSGDIQPTQTSHPSLPTSIRSTPVQSPRPSEPPPTPSAPPSDPTTPSVPPSDPTTPQSTNTISPTTGTNTENPTPSEESSSSSLQTVLYVVAGVAAVFAMIIIVLSILCVGLCVRKSQTIDLETLKRQEKQTMRQDFSTTGTSMVPNGVYNGRLPDMMQGSSTAATQLSGHSQAFRVPAFSDYNILGERDYEVIDLVDDKYHHLQRPSLTHSIPPKFGPIPNGSSLRSMSTIGSMSSQPNGNFPRNNGATAVLSQTENRRRHPYRNFETIEERNPNEALYSPTSEMNPETPSCLQDTDSITQLLPNGQAATTRSPATLSSDVHESLYSPAGTLPVIPPPPYPHELEKIPETGTMFPEPSDPSAFPLHEYDYIPASAGYETPVPSRSKMAVVTIPPKAASSTPSASLASSNLTGGCTPVLVVPPRMTNTLSTDSTGSFTVDTRTVAVSIEDFAVNSSADFTANSEMTDYPRHSLTGCSATGDSTTADFTWPDFTSSTGESFMASRTAPNFMAHGANEFILPQKSSTIGSPVTIPDNNMDQKDVDTSTGNSDFTGPIIFPHMVQQRQQATQPRRHHYKSLDPNTMEPELKYTKLQVGKKTLV